MACLKYGPLFEKKVVIYKNKKYEIFKLLDYVVGIGFVNANNHLRCNVVSGFYSGSYASGEIKNANDGEYVFIQDPINLNDLIEKNCDIVKFESIKEMRLSEFGKYYFRYIGDKIKLLRNQEIITYLQTQEKEIQQYYDKDKIKSLGTIKQASK